MTQQAAATGRNIDINGVSIYIEEQGKGVPVVLVHGGTMTASMYEATVPLLSNDFRVVTFDSRGHGRSTNPTGELNYGAITDDTAALIDALGLDRPFVGGWSDGGQVALEFGLRHPSVARGLIVGAAYTDFQSEAAQAMVRSIFGTDETDIIDFDAFERNAPGFVGFLESIHPRGPKQWQAVAQQTLTMYLEYSGLQQEHIEHIQTPAIVILGDRDSISLDEALNLYRWLPNAELAILPGADHMRPMMDPATFAAVTLDFMRRHS